MKNHLKQLLFSALLLVCLAFAGTAFSQAPPPPPPPGGGHGAEGNGEPGGGAPIEGGLGISLALIAGYGAWKWYKVKQQKKEAVEN